jgi:L-ascorbate metabolism protein UlaG (beta-lactamase superfamily)
MPPTEKPKAEGVSITWFGQSSFLCQDAEGTSVLIDPFDLRVGYPDPGLHETEVDVMLITHEHFDHNNTKLVKTAANIVRGSGLHQANRVLVKGIASSHGPNGGGTPNTIFTWELGGIKFCHLGDLGVLLSEEQISQIGPVDVLFIPVGGYYTIDSAQATQVVEALKPKVVIPMHYRTPALASSIANMLATADVFLQGKEQHPDSGKHTVTLSKETLPKTTQVLAMAYQ